MINDRQLMERKKRSRVLLKTLERLFPRASIALSFSNPWELVVAVILSAQCTDKKVNEVTAILFKKYKTLNDYVHARRGEFEKIIRPVGFYRTKAKHILQSARMVSNHFSGKIPRTMQELCRLPGVARKTANIVLGNAFGIVEGIAVDTHVRRFALKFHLTDSKNPDRIERDLMKLFPKKQWLSATYRIIEYGRRVCPARVHNCLTHPLSLVYPPAAHTWPRAH